MNIFLALLNEQQEEYEGDGFVHRISSLISYSSRHTEVYDPSSADAVVFLESNRFKSRHDFGFFQKTDLLMEFAHKAYTINYADSPIAFLPGLYVALPRRSFDYCWTRAIPFPWASPNKQLQGFKSDNDDPEYKASFRGSLSHPIRQKVLDVLSVHPELGQCIQDHGWFDHTLEEQLDYLIQIANSKFIVCPRGGGTSTYRLYEAIKLGRVPIIISDDWVPPDSINCNSFSVTISEKRIADLPALVDSYLARWPAMSSAALSAWNTYFQDSVLADYLFDQLESLTFTKQPDIDWPSLNLRWRSASFRKQNNWDYLSRAKRLIRRI